MMHFAPHSESTSCAWLIASAMLVILLGATAAGCTTTESVNTAQRPQAKAAPPAASGLILGTAY
jgi:hypothetical protein